jgi:hypothetical protein
VLALRNSRPAISPLVAPREARSAICGRRELGAGALGKGFGSCLQEHLVGRSQLVAGVQAPLLAAEPLAVQEVRPRLAQVSPGVRQVLDRVLVELLGMGVAGQQRL